MSSKKTKKDDKNYAEKIEVPQSASKPSARQTVRGLKVNIQLVEEQKKVVESFYKHDYTFVHGDAGCLAFNTKVMMSDGSLKSVQDIVVNDTLMGDDNTARTVLSLKRGREQMWWIKQNSGIDYRVNSNHVLSLKKTHLDKTHNIKVIDLLNELEINSQVKYYGYKKIGVENQLEITTISIEKDIIDDYYGFTLDGNNLFKLSDGTVTHNSGKTLAGVYTALNHLIKGECREIWITRPMLKNNLAALPGAQPLTSKILTPNGWTTMGKIQKGDQVINVDGTTSNVLDTFPHGVRKVYEIEMKDGSKTRACDKHLWEVKLMDVDGNISESNLYNTTKLSELITTKTIILPKAPLVEYSEANTQNAYMIGSFLIDTHQESPETNVVIPYDLLFSSYEQRMELIRGLLYKTDTTKSTHILKVTSDSLRRDITNIVKSVGGSVLVKNEDGFIVIQIALKGLFNDEPTDILELINTIENITYVSDEEVKCILIDHPRHLYITDDYIVTHNTLEEKLYPYTFPIIQNIEVCIGKENCDKLLESKTIRIMPIEVAKGCTFMDSAVLVEEYQDMDYDDFRTIISRLGNNSKMILCGSKQQINKMIGRDSAIYRTDVLEGRDDVGFITLKANHRSESLTTLLPLLDKFHDEVSEKYSTINSKKILKG